LNKAKKGDFVFVDPPYDGDTFTSYSSKGFNKDNQTALANKLIELDSKGVK
jgi:site-specific DNA-adenine methylase